MSLTVKVATPAPSSPLETVVIVEEPPDLASVTVLPGDAGATARPCSVTVTVEVATPFAVTEAGAALTVDCAAVDEHRR